MWPMCPTICRPISYWLILLSTGKSRGFALFVYKSAEGAQAALVEPVKNIDGRQMTCKLAIDGKKGKPGTRWDDAKWRWSSGERRDGDWGIWWAWWLWWVFWWAARAAGSNGSPSSLESSGVGAGALSGSGGGAGSAYGSGLGGPYGGYGGPGSTGYKNFKYDMI